MTAYLDKHNGELFAEKCKKNGDSQGEVLRQAAYDYLGKSGVCRA
ncbi:ribbon-helix-helix domain-containing protein [Escherichia coli]